jgi:predicted kinase
MSRLFIPVGIPGCGKSTWGQMMFGPKNCYSTDAIRAEPEFGGDVNSQENNDAVFTEFHRRILRDLETFHLEDVYADATNLTARARKTLYSLADIANAEVHVVVFTNNIQAVNRNQKRERQVPVEVMHRMIDNYERFELDFPYELESVKSVTRISSLV